VIRLKKTVLTSEVLKNLRSAFGDEEDAILADCESGRAVAWEVVGHGVVITRIERGPSGRELVLVAGAGKGMALVLEGFREIARNNNIETIRIHSARRGMWRMLRKSGYKEVERVYRLKVGG